MSKVIHATDDNFKDIVLKSEKPVLVDFWATWCGPCKALAPILDEISTTRDDVTIVKVEIDENKNLAKTYGIRSIPTMYLFDKGEISATKMGSASKNALTSWIDDNL